jgi:hypothetical protein
VKETTHYVFFIGLSFYVLSLFHLSSLASSLVSVWLSFAVNFVIDALGHVPRSGIPTRSRLTHSVFTAPVWGCAIAWVSISTIPEALGSHPALSTVIPWMAMGALIAFGHLLLDSVTQAGVYSFRRRIALAHFSYDNPILNAGFALVGVTLAIASFLA